MPTVQPVEQVDSQEHVNKISTRGNAYVSETFESVVNPSLIVLTSDSGGIQFPSASVGRVRVFSESGNDPVYIGGIGGNAPYILSNGIAKGWEMFGGEKEEFQVSNMAALAGIASTSGQRVRVFGFIHDNDVTVEPNDPPKFDAVAPVILAVEPVSGFSGVPVNIGTTISVLFDEEIASGGINSGTIQVKVSGAAIGYSGALLKDASNPMRITFVPQHGFSGASLHQFIIRSGGITDVWGNAIESGIVSTFTTVEGTASDQDPPFVISHTPVSGSIEEHLNVQPTVSFSEQLQSGFVNTNTIALKQAGIPVSGFVTLEPDQMTCTFSPTADLTDGVVYTMNASGVKDLAGNTQIANSGLSFPFIPTRPFISSLDPVSGFSGTQFGSPSEEISIMFNKEVASGSANINSGTVQVKVSGASIGYSGTLFRDATNPKKVTFSPMSGFSGGRLHQFIIRSGGITDLAGFAIQSGVTSRFTTNSGNPSDPNPPFVSSFVPASGITNASLTLVPTVTFNEALDGASVNGSTISLKVAGVPVSGTITLQGDNKTCVFTPDNLLTQNVVHTMTASGVRDITLNTQLAASGLSFPFTPTKPIITVVSPVSGALGVPLDPGTQISVTFNQVIETSSINSGTIQCKVSGASLGYSGTLLRDPSDTKKVIFTPQSGFSGGRVHQFIVRSGGITELFGIAVQSGIVSRFTTTTSDSTAPFVSSHTPLSGATTVALATNPQIVYNEQLQSGTVNTSTIVLQKGPVLIGGSISLTADLRTCTFDPTTDLDQNTTYTMTASGVKDLAGNTQLAASGLSFPFLTTTNLSSIYNENDNNSSVEMGESDNSRAGIRVQAGHNMIGRKPQRVRFKLSRDGSLSHTFKVEHIASNGSVKQKFYRNGTEFIPASSIGTSKGDYDFDVSGLSQVNFANNDAIILNVSGANGTDTNNCLRVYRNSSNVESDCVWISSNWEDSSFSEFSDRDWAGIIWEPV